MSQKRTVTMLRMVFVVGAIILATLLTTGALFLVALTAPQLDVWLFVPSLALVGILIAPLTLGSLLAFWDVETSPEARRVYRRALWVVVGLQVLAGIVMTAYCVFTGASIWLAIVFVLVGVALTGAAVTVGPVVRRVEDSGADNNSAAWQMYTPVEFRSDLRKAGLTAAITLVATTLLVGVLMILLGTTEWSLFAWPFVFALFSVSAVCTIVIFRLSHRQRDALGGDLGRVRTIGKAVLRDKTTGLSEEDAVAATKFAQLSWVTQGYQIASLTFLYVGIAGTQIVSLSSGSPNPFAVWILAVLALVFIVMIPISLVQLRRTRRYATEHRELIS